MSENHIKKFENNEIRTVWNFNAEEYYISVVDIIAAITGSKNHNDYWYRLKKRKGKRN